MAVSGKKVSDFCDSIFKSSAEDFDNSCEPCLATGQHIEAYEYCVNCQKYLCKSCFAYQQRLRATQNHQLLDQESMNQHPIQRKVSALCTATCHLHNDKIISYFCTNDEVLCCTDCITMNQINSKIEYIPHKCRGIGDSEEYRETMRELDKKINDLDTVIKKATLRDKEIESSHDHIMKEIVLFRKEINDRLDQLQKQVQTNADKKKVKDKQSLKFVLETCTAVSSDIKKFKSNLQDSKTSKQDEQLYIMIKQAKSKLKLDDLKEARESMEQTKIKQAFERSKELENLLAKPDIFGKLSLSSAEVTAKKTEEKLCQFTQESPRKKIVFDKLTHRGDIDIGTKSDRSYCSIRGCAELTSNRLVLVDSNNSKLKVVDKESKAVTEETTLDSKPWDIVVLPQEKIAVTIPDKNEILIMATAGKLSIVRRIPVKGHCRGLTYHQGQLYVVCENPNSVFIFDTQGQINNTISLCNEIFRTPHYILLNEAAGHIYISDYKSNSVVSITLEGDITAVYQNNGLKRPAGMMMLDDGSLLVCCYIGGDILHISGDMRQGQPILQGLRNSQSISYSLHEQEIYICGQSDKLKIMTKHAVRE